MASDRCLPTHWLPPVPSEAGVCDRMYLDQLLDVERDIDRNYSPSRALEVGDPSVYTGAAGIAFMFWRLCITEAAVSADQKQQWLKKASMYSDAAVRTAKPHGKGLKTSTFLTGSAGVYSVAAAVAYTRNDTKQAAAYRKQVLLLASTCVAEGVPSELLYGRTGYLCCLLFMAANAGLDLKECGEIISGAIQLILKDGTALATAEFPLMWEWHEKEYLGAAHGVCGILTVLLHFRSILDGFGCVDKVNQTVDQLLRIRFPSGNLPSSLSNASDRLVHWCHGAPGLVALLGRMHAAHGGSSQYQEAALAAGKVVMQRGLLTKGFGICHGISGNALALLALHRDVGSEEALEKAKQFALFSIQPSCAGETDAAEVKRRLMAAPDRPSSLFEGSAGLGCLLIALLEPRSSSLIPRTTGAATPWQM